MAGMSPLGRLILIVMRAGSICAAGFVLLVIVIELSKRWLGGGFETMKTPDMAFLGILFLVLVGFLALARGITREMKKNDPSV